MFKKILLFSLGCLMPFLASAQLRLGLSAGYALPTGDFGVINKNGYGGSLSAKYALSPRFALTSNFSFYAFGRAGEDLGDLVQIFGISESTVTLLQLIGFQVDIPKTDFIPVNIGFEYYFTQSKWQPYIGFDLGMYINNTETIELDLRPFSELADLPPGVDLGVIELNGNDANPGGALVLGSAFHFDDLLSLDLNIKANGIYVPEDKVAVTVFTFNFGVFFNIPSRVTPSEPPKIN